MENKKTPCITAFFTLLAIMIAAGLWSPPVYAEIRFEEVRQYPLTDYSSKRTFGASWGDFNGDGWPDLWVNNHAQKPVLYLNNADGTFITDSNDSYVESDRHGAAWADFDNDGDQDLFQIAGGGSGAGEGPNQFFINYGSNKLQDDEAGDYLLKYSLGRGRTPLWFDWNGDGYLDIFLSNLTRPDGQALSALFTQRDGYFTNDNDLTGINTNMRSDPAFAQLTHLTDRNIPALVIYSNPSPHRIYRYDTIPFKDVTDTLGFPSTWGIEDTAIADFNGDLLTDFYLARAYLSSVVVKHDDTSIRAGILMVDVDNEKSFSFSATGDVTFKIETYQITTTDIYIGSARNNPTSKTFTLSTTDAAGIPDPDTTPVINFGVFIGYDNGTWRFSVRTDSWLMLHISVNATSISDPINAVGFDSSNGAEEDRLFIQTADGGFLDFTDTNGSEINTPSACHSVATADFDNDMDMDIYLVCRSIVQNLPNIFYENLGNNKFRAVTDYGAEGSTIGLGESVAIADYDLDGFMDIFITNGKYSSSITEGPHQLFRNVDNGNHWLEVDLQGVISNRDGIGARVLATAGGITQLREQDGGIHLYSQNYQRIHFGLADNTKVEQLTIQWPSGIVQEINNIDADQIFQAVELDFTGSPTSGTEPPLTVYFTSGDYLSYEWDFDNDGNTDSTDQNPSYIYNRPGKYTVKLTVTDSDGTVITATRTDYIEINNNLPSTPQLIYPADDQAGLGTTVEFIWEKSTDPDGDTVTYNLYVCRDENFTKNCITKENIASLENKSIYYAGTSAGLLIFGIVLIGGTKSKSRMALLLITMVIVAMLSVSCGSRGGSGGDNTPPPEIITQPGNEVAQIVSGLSTRATYYWKVAADDGNGGIRESGTKSFQTQ